MSNLKSCLSPVRKRSIPAEAAQAKWMESAIFIFSIALSRLNGATALHRKAETKIQSPTDFAE